MTAQGRYQPVATIQKLFRGHYLKEERLSPRPHERASVKLLRELSHGGEYQKTTYEERASREVCFYSVKAKTKVWAEVWAD